MPTASPTTKTLAEALVAFQADIPVVKKSSTADTGKYSYSYASLEKLVELAYPKLTALGLAYTAAATFDEQGNFVLRAKLLHVSGEFTGGDYPLGNPNAPAQAVGSAVSYARRYQFLNLTGIVPEGEDDDGAAASKVPAASKAPAQRAPEQAAAEGEESISSLKHEIELIIGDKSNDITGADVNAIMAEVSGGKTPAKWTLTDLRKGLKAVKEKI